MQWWSELKDSDCLNSLSLLDLCRSSLTFWGKIVTAELHEKAPLSCLYVQYKATDSK